jgi:hypothetical protein
MERKYNTHIVYKTKDALKYLTAYENETMARLLYKIDQGRRAEGKKLNTYHICNLDEPYADKVLQVILDGEAQKEASDEND